MLNIFNLFVFIVWSVSCISVYGIHSLQSEPSYELDRLYANQEDNNNGVVHFHRKEKRDSITKQVLYWLYTRKNITGQLLSRSEPHMIESSTYNAKDPTKVLVHGWMGRDSKHIKGLCTMSVKSYLQVGDYNVICVDWKSFSSDMTYVTTRTKTKLVAKDIAEVLDKITYKMTIGADALHLIGHSLGAHIVGFVGKIKKNKIPRITGLDPAKPMFEHSSKEDRLDKTDSPFVDVIHTNGGKNAIFRSLGHIDFYPNGGKAQPNCRSLDRYTGACSHSTACYYFSLSILTKKNYLSFNCPSWDDFQANNCTNSDTTYMGEFVDKKKFGDYYLLANG